MEVGYGKTNATFYYKKTIADRLLLGADWLDLCNFCCSVRSIPQRRIPGYCFHAGLCCKAWRNWTIVSDRLSSCPGSHSGAPRISGMRYRVGTVWPLCRILVQLYRHQLRFDYLLLSGEKIRNAADCRSVSPREIQQMVGLDCKKQILHPVSVPCNTAAAVSGRLSLLFDWGIQNGCEEIHLDYSTGKALVYSGIQPGLCNDIRSDKKL